MIKRNLLLIGLSALISACGFQLRGTGEAQFALQEIGLSARNAYGATVKQTRKGLENSGVTVTDRAPYTLSLTREEQSSRSISFTSNAQGAEKEITKTLEYQILGKNRVPLLGSQLEVQRTYITDENNIAGAGEAAIQVEGEMTRAMVQQLLGRIQMITPEQLDALQAKADADAKAAAEALEAARKADEAERQQQGVPFELPKIPVQLQSE